MREGAHTKYAKSLSRAPLKLGVGKKEGGESRPVVPDGGGREWGAKGDHRWAGGEFVV